MFYYVLAVLCSVGFLITRYIASRSHQRKTKRIAFILSSVCILALAGTVVLAMVLPNNASGPSPVVPEDKPAISQTNDDNATAYYAKPLITGTSSNTTEGAVTYGATMVLGDLDEYSRSTFAHIQLKNEQEPGNNNESREEHINVDPIGWRNFKLNGNWANNRCHLIGYQFSGLNNELRNLSIGTSYLNKGSEGNGMDESNPEGMLFYEQRLDAWLEENPTHRLDLYVQPLYTENHTTPYAYYMQWVGISPEGTTIPIDIQGNSATTLQNAHYVILENQSPSYIVDTATGNITLR